MAKSICVSNIGSAARTKKDTAQFVCNASKTAAIVLEHISFASMPILIYWKKVEAW